MVLRGYHRATPRSSGSGSSSRRRPPSSATCFWATTSRSGTRPSCAGTAATSGSAPRSNVQDNCTLHVTSGHGPPLLEEEVTLGHNAVVHACTIRRGALIGMNATVLDDADVGASALVAAGAVVLPGHGDPAGDALGGQPREEEAGPDAGRGRRHSRRTGRTTSTTRRSTSSRDREREGDAGPPPARDACLEPRRGGRARGLRALRLRRDPDAGPRVDGALRAERRRGDGHRPQGDVHVHGPRRPLRDAPAREHGGRRPRVRRALARAGRAPVEALLHRAAVPVRAPAEGPLPRVPADRRGGPRARGRGNGRRGPRHALRLPRAARLHGALGVAQFGGNRSHAAGVRRGRSGVFFFE